jgi:hypothetical protein
MRKLIALFCGAALTLAMVAPAAACDEPVGDCPPGDGWMLQPLGFVIPEFDNGNYKDQNDDGYVCVKFNKGQAKKAPPLTGAYTVKDNTKPLKD